MSVWDNLGAKVGIGACTVEVAVSTPWVGWSEPAEGTIGLSGGRVPQEVTSLRVSLVEHWTTVVMVGKTPVTQHHYKVHDEAVLAEGLTISPGEQREFAFRLTAPWGVPFNHHWFVGARVSIPGAADRHARCDFKLCPPPVFLAVAGVLSEVARMPVKSWTGYPSGVRGELKGDAAARAILDGVRLELGLEGESIHGRVTVNPQEHTVGDVLRSMVRADRETSAFRFAAGDLAAAREAFEAALRPHLDALRKLPIPSASPVPDPGELPRAASEPDPSPVDLPRSVP